MIRGVRARRALIRWTMLASVLVASVFLIGGAAIHAPPTSPKRVLDGDRVGFDIDRSEWSAGYGASWSKAIDETGRPVKYELCLREPDERCDDERWFSVGAERVTSGTLQMSPGDWILSCVRARDIEGEYSKATCSDGFRVVADPSEIESVMERRAEVGLPADRATVEKQANSGAYGETWFGLEPPVADGEKPDYTSLEFQTWTIDHGRNVEALFQRGIAVTVPSGTRVLQVIAAARSCSPTDELRSAFGARAVDSAPAPVRAPTYTLLADPPLSLTPSESARTFPRPSDARVRLLVTRYVLTNPQYQAIDIERVEYLRQGVHLGCQYAIVEWLSRRDVRRHLAGFGFKYVSAGLNADKVRVSSDDVTDVPGTSSLIIVRKPIRGTSMTA